MNYPSRIALKIPTQSSSADSLLDESHITVSMSYDNTKNAYGCTFENNEEDQILSRGLIEFLRDKGMGMVIHETTIIAPDDSRKITYISVVEVKGSKDIENLITLANDFSAKDVHQDLERYRKGGRSHTVLNIPKCR